MSDIKLQQLPSTVLITPQEAAAIVDILKKRKINVSKELEDSLRVFHSDPTVANQNEYRYRLLEVLSTADSTNVFLSSPILQLVLEHCRFDFLNRQFDRDVEEALTVYDQEED